MDYNRYLEEIKIDIDHQLIRVLLDGSNDIVDLRLLLKKIKNSSELDKSISLIAYILSYRNPSLEVVTMLLEKGVNPNNYWLSYSALLSIKETKVINFLDIFVKSGVNLNLVDENGYTLLRLACIWEDIKLIKKLLSLGASAIIQDNYGQTALSSFFAYINNENYDKPKYKITKKQYTIIKLLDNCARKEMEKFKLINKNHLSVQDWRCNYKITD